MRTEFTIYVFWVIINSNINMSNSLHGEKKTILTQICNIYIYILQVLFIFILNRLQHSLLRFMILIENLLYFVCFRCRHSITEVFQTSRTRYVLIHGNTCMFCVNIFIPSHKVLQCKNVYIHMYHGYRFPGVLFQSVAFVVIFILVKKSPASDSVCLRLPPI